MLQPQLKPKSELAIEIAIVYSAAKASASNKVETDLREIIQSLQVGNISLSAEIISVDPTELYELENKSYDIILLYEWEKSPSKLEQWLKKIIEQKNIPIIIIEENSSIERVKEYQKLGIKEMISKDKIECLPEKIERSLVVEKQFNRQKEPVAHLVRKEKKREELPISIARKINATLNPEKVLEYISIAVGETFNLERVIICTKVEREIKIAKQWRSNETVAELNWEKILLEVDEEITEKTAAGEIEKIHEKIAREIKIAAARSLICKPIFQQGKYCGSIILYRNDERRIFVEEIETIEIIAELIAIVLDKIATAAKIDRLEAEKEDALTADRLKSEFIAHISHEFRNPLTAIMGFARMLGEEIYGSLNSKQMQYIKAVSASGKHLLELINDLLDLSKIEADREEIYLEPVPIEEVCLASMSMVQEIAAQKGLELKLAVYPQVSFCMADQRRLKQILVNLLSNAVKFTEEGGVTLQVKENPETIEFSVIDTGIGIDRANCQKIFEPFIQIKSHLSKKYKGTGLGLPLSAKLAKLHGGNLSVTSEIGKGSCFTLSLPK